MPRFMLITRGKPVLVAGMRFQRDVGCWILDACLDVGFWMLDFGDVF